MILIILLALLPFAIDYSLNKSKKEDEILYKKIVKEELIELINDSLYQTVIEDSLKTKKKKKLNKK